MDRRLALPIIDRQNGPMRIDLIFFYSLLLLSACVEWPDVDAPRTSRGNAGWPELQPSSTLSATTGDAEELASAALQARAAALRRRAILMRKPVTNETDFERLRTALAR